MDLVGFGTRPVSCDMSKVRAWTPQVTFISTVHLLLSQCSHIDILTIRICDRNTYSLYRSFAHGSLQKKAKEACHHQTNEVRFVYYLQFRYL